jgi:hypothetical protein
MVVTIHAKPRRIAERREHQKTEAFQTKYRKRSGIEATNSLLKRVTGLGRLRVRGKPSVFMAMVLKVVGWNILQASRSTKLMKALVGTFLSLARYLLLSGNRWEGSGVIARRPSLTTWILQAIPKPKASKIKDFCRLCPAKFVQCGVPPYLKSVRARIRQECRKLFYFVSKNRASPPKA